MQKNDSDAHHAQPSPLASSINTVFSRPCYQVFDNPTPLDGKLLKPGVWHLGKKSSRGEEEAPTHEWLCGPLHVDAITHSQSQNADYGRLLRIQNRDGHWLTWAMPEELLAGRPQTILAKLYSMGLEIDYQSHRQVMLYIASQAPEQRIICTPVTGWHGASLFVTPLECIGQGQAIYQTGDEAVGEYDKAGTLDGWRETIGAALSGNPLLQLGIGTALAATLLAPLNLYSSGGFHLLWDSSNGKTVVVQCAASVWGHGVHFTLKWNATANGLEGIAALRNDCLLALDELGQADPHSVGDVVYSMADGIGKQRAGSSTAARQVRRWRVMLLSSGEVTLETKMAEAGKRTRAGQEVRLVTLSAGRTHGAFDNLHKHPDGATFAEALVLASVSNDGHVGPEFVRRLIASGDMEKLATMLATIRANFPANTGQSARVAMRFALVALALELAVDMELLPIASGEGTSSMIELFKNWLAERGAGPCEDKQILRAVRDFIDRHGSTRFQSLITGEKGVRDRAGYLENGPNGRWYLFNRSGLEEATRGFELTRVTRTLDKVGALVKKEPGKMQHKKRLPDGSSPGLYWIDPTRLEPSD